MSSQEVPKTVGETQPSLPNDTPVLSFWHRQTRAFKYLNANDSSTVPPSSPYVVIGSGISGALTAFSLIQEGALASDILILEAREAASGASSRNAGHVRPDAFRGFSGFAAVHGQEQARKIIENEKLVLERVEDFVNKNNIDCDINVTNTFDVCLTPEFSAFEAQSFEQYRNAGGDLDHVNFYDGEEARTKTHISAALTAYEWPAASIHPAKLANWILTSVIEKGAKLWTHCPATSITPSSTSKWDIHTRRGTVAAQTVIHCTNAYSAYLLPQLRGFVTPNKAQAHSIIPNAALSGNNVLHSTYSLRFSVSHFYSLIQRQSDGTIILGASRTNPNLSQETKDALISFDDTGSNPEITDDAHRNFKKVFPKYSELCDIRQGEGLDKAWIGIIAKTADSVPCIGAVPGLDGQWICAGFNGHGMARIFTCAPGLAKLVCGKTWEDTGLPECFQLTKERLGKYAKDQ